MFLHLIFNYLRNFPFNTIHGLTHIFHIVSLNTNQLHTIAVETTMPSWNGVGPSYTSLKRYGVPLTEFAYNRMIEGNYEMPSFSERRQIFKTECQSFFISLVLDTAIAFTTVTTVYYYQSIKLCLFHGICMLNPSQDHINSVITAALPDHERAIAVLNTHKNTLFISKNLPWIKLTIEYNFQDADLKRNKFASHLASLAKESLPIRYKAEIDKLILRYVPDYINNILENGYGNLVDYYDYYQYSGTPPESPEKAFNIHKDVFVKAYKNKMDKIWIEKWITNAIKENLAPKYADDRDIIGANEIHTNFAYVLIEFACLFHMRKVVEATLKLWIDSLTISKDSLRCHRERNSEGLLLNDPFMQFAATMGEDMPKADSLMEAQDRLDKYQGQVVMPANLHLITVIFKQLITSECPANNALALRLKDFIKTAITNASRSKAHQVKLIQADIEIALVSWDFYEVISTQKILNEYANALLMPENFHWIEKQISENFSSDNQSRKAFASEHELRDCKVNRK